MEEEAGSCIMPVYLFVLIDMIIDSMIPCGYIFAMAYIQSEGEEVLSIRLLEASGNSCCCLYFLFWLVGWLMSKIEDKIPHYVTFRHVCIYNKQIIIQ